MWFFRYFVHQLIHKQNAYVQKRGITQLEIYQIGSKVD